MSPEGELYYQTLIKLFMEMRRKIEEENAEEVQIFLHDFVEQLKEIKRKVIEGKNENEI